MKLFKEYIFPRLILDLFPFYPMLMIFGIYSVDLHVDLNVIIGIFICYLILVIAFVYNDIADREADAPIKYAPHSFLNHLKSNLGLYKSKEGRRFRNIFCNESRNVFYGYIFLIVAVSLVLFLSLIFIGPLNLLLSIVMIFFAFAYSGTFFTLKKYAGFDLITHAFLLATSEIFFFWTFEESEIKIYSWIILIGATLYSVGGDLDNEYRDFDDDQGANLKNTAHFLGKTLTKQISVLCVILGIAFTVVGMVYRFVTMGSVY